MYMCNLCVKCSQNKCNYIHIITFVLSTFSYPINQNKTINRHINYISGFFLQSLMTIFHEKEFNTEPYLPLTYLPTLLGSN